MASITKRGKTWQYTVSAKPKAIRKGGFRTKREAQIAAVEIENELRKGTVPHLRLEPINEYFEGWIKSYKKDISTITLRIYYGTLKTIDLYFGDRPIQHIKKREYQEFLDDYAMTHAKESTRKLNVHIRSCVQTAIEEGILHQDFTKNVKVSGSVEAKKPEEKYLNYEDSISLLEECYKQKEKSLAYYVIILALTTGMRFSEIVGLTRKDFDFKNNTININKTWDYKQGKEFIKTKTDLSNRIITMDKVTMKNFERLFKTLPLNVHNLVFFSPSSKYKVVSNDNVNRLLKTLLTKLGIEAITVHGLRHTHASVLLYKKVSIYYVSERLGHAGIDITLRTYSHVVKELRKEDEQNTAKTFETMVSNV